MNLEIPLKFGNCNSGYSSHILNTGHTCGTICDIIDVITTGKKEHI
jgi:hypothetical protein